MAFWHFAKVVHYQVIIVHFEAYDMVFLQHDLLSFFPTSAASWKSTMLFVIFFTNAITNSLRRTQFYILFVRKLNTRLDRKILPHPPVFLQPCFFCFCFVAFCSSIRVTSNPQKCPLDNRYPRSSTIPHYRKLMPCEVNASFGWRKWSREGWISPEKKEEIEEF